MNYRWSRYINQIFDLLHMAKVYRSDFFHELQIVDVYKSIFDVLQMVKMLETSMLF